MAVAGWLVDKSVAARAAEPAVAEILAALAGALCICPIGELEQLYSSRSAEDYDRHQELVLASLTRVPAPADLLERALRLQRDLAHHHGMWHRTPIPDLLIAETALEHDLGVLHLDGHFDRIAEVRPLTVRRV